MDLLKARDSLERLLHGTGNGETMAARRFHMPPLL